MPIPIDPTLALASAAGAAASTLANSSDSRGRRAAEGMAGALVGVFCGPAIADLAAVANEHSRLGIAFAAGAAGYLVLTAFLDVMKGGQIREWLLRLLGKPPA